MKLSIEDKVRGLDMGELVSTLAFINEDDEGFIREKGETSDELISKIIRFFDGKDTATLKEVSKDLHEYNPKLNQKIFISQINKKVDKGVGKGGITLTDNQSMVMDCIRRLMNKNGLDRIRTDNVDIRDKSKFFIGGVITTLKEKGLISIDIYDKKKYITITNHPKQN